MTALYPLKFRTIFKDKIWGGHKIKSILEKDYAPLPNCGETWEISGVEGNLSKVAEGDLRGCDLLSLLDTYREQLVGGKVFERYGLEFPLLVKFIDANDDLSVQVHPDDEMAHERHNSFGKTEMWYIFQADEGARLNAGFNRQMNKKQYRQYVEDGKVMEILNWVDVQADDVFFLPAGRVHSIGKGILLAEIQQTSDITYRIYDFDRRDDQGNQRDLHTEEALDAIDFTYHNEYKTKYKDRINEVVELVQCPYFTTNKLHFKKEVSRNYADLDSFVIYVCMEGRFTLRYSEGEINVRKGDAILVPAVEKNITLAPDTEFKILESYIS
jgi:mannose-6-phosphate isomerase